MAPLLCLGALALALRLADRFYYRDADRVLGLLRLAPRTQGAPVGVHRPLDRLFCWFPFLWIWCDILIAVWLGRLAGDPLAWLFVAIFVGGRMRALQEAAHTAVHSGLCRSKRYQRAIANLFAQWPLGRVDMHHRYIGHVTEHHWHANELDADPNVRRFVAVGVVPGITLADWRRKLWYPFTLAGFAETLRNLTDGTFRKNVHPALVPLRLAVTAGFCVLLWAVGGMSGVMLGFVVPLVTVYPFFSWISVLAEHRWFVRCDATDRKTRECINGRPTDYPGVLGGIVKHLVFPFSDHYHLAHSLYPSLRWNYLPAIDRALREQLARYARYHSVGLVRSRGGRPSALSELCERLTTPDHPDLADWARDLAGVPAGRRPDPINT